MENKLLTFGSITVCVVLVLAGLSPVVGYNSVESGVKDSPLFHLRTQRAIDKGQNIQTCTYLGKGIATDILFPRQDSSAKMVQRVINRLRSMEEEEFNIFIYLIIPYLEKSQGIISKQEILESLNKIRDEGLENVFKRHKKLARATREAMKAIGLELLAPESPSDAVTAVRAPTNIPAGDIKKLLKTKYGITVAGGQEHLKGKIFRIAHLGYFEIYDIIMVVGAIEMALKDLGYPMELSTGVRVAQEILYQD